MLYPERLILTEDHNKSDDFFHKLINNCDKNYPTISLRIEKKEPVYVSLIAYGGMAPLAAKAAMNFFLEEEVLSEVLIPSLIKPLPIEDILPSVQESGRVIIIEEGIKTSGWGAELSSQISEKAFAYLKKPIERIGAKEFPIPSSKPLESEVLPDIKDIERSLFNI